ncbi:MAG: response regulator, partial [Acidobacteriota bacterium]
MNTPSPSFTILLVDDEPAWLRSMALTLESAAGITNTIPCQDSAKVMGILEQGGVGLVLLDLNMPGLGGEELLAMIAERHPEIACIVVSGMDQLAGAIRCMKLGAYDYLVKTDEEERIVGGVLRAVRMLELRDENREVASRLVTGGPRHPEAFTGIVTRSRAMRAIFAYLEAVATSPQPLLVTGESGV